MKTQDEIQKFMELRAEGLSFDKIAKRLGISKQTLINWSKRYSSEIANLKALRLEALKEEYCLAVEAKVQLWGKLVNDIKAELADRDLSTVPTDKLLDMLIKAQRNLEQAYIEPYFTAVDNEEDREREATIDRLNALKLYQKFTG